MPVKGIKCMVYAGKCQSGMFWRNVIIVITLKISGLPLITVMWPVWGSDSKDKEGTLSFSVASWPYLNILPCVFSTYPHAEKDFRACILSIWVFHQSPTTTSSLTKSSSSLPKYILMPLVKAVLMYIEWICVSILLLGYDITASAVQCEWACAFRFDH